MDVSSSFFDKRCLLGITSVFSCYIFLVFVRSLFILFQLGKYQFPPAEPRLLEQAHYLSLGGGTRCPKKTVSDAVPRRVLGTAC
ncbi:hypothetical protein EVAR_54851_1 [Eumeta japonica]|uniref:Uncharacterized protein n=1 Tax=Eumeta variegata TaxID=151549 RepID=A0A4C1YGN8_EUMVA|nr:hypothetical protein EVAR_54851_1 [Eumeta japonica]